MVVSTREGPLISCAAGVTEPREDVSRHISCFHLLWLSTSYVLGYFVLLAVLMSTVLRDLRIGLRGVLLLMEYHCERSSFKCRQMWVFEDVTRWMLDWGGSDNGFSDNLG